MGGRGTGWGWAFFRLSTSCLLCFTPPAFVPCWGAGWTPLGSTSVKRSRKGLWAGVEAAVWGVFMSSETFSSQPRRMAMDSSNIVEISPGTTFHLFFATDKYSTVFGVSMASLLGLLAEQNVGQSRTHTVLLGKAKTPVIWDLSSACNKCFLKCLYLFFFLFSFLCSGFFVCFQ